MGVPETMRQPVSVYWRKRSWAALAHFDADGRIERFEPWPHDHPDAPADDRLSVKSCIGTLSQRLEAGERLQENFADLAHDNPCALFLPELIRAGLKAEQEHGPAMRDAFALAAERAAG